MLSLTVLDIIRNRYSVRSYLKKSLKKNDLIKILDAARFAQSADNRQPWEFILVTESDTKERLAQASGNQNFVSEAAAVLVCLANPARSARVGPFEGFLIDLAIAIENMALAAWDFGIGSCWIGLFDEEKVKDILAISDNLRVVSLLTLGYPSEKVSYKDRKPLTEIIHYEKYGRK